MTFCPWLCSRATITSEDPALPVEEEGTAPSCVGVAALKPVELPFDAVVAEALATVVAVTIAPAQVVVVAPDPR